MIGWLLITFYVLFKELLFFEDSLNMEVLVCKGFSFY